ncbi:MAG: hypothetical protein L6Q71_06470 [Planctomycetes bacterium]|nr:hypothetical protein [Planctomycetota bacterium]NUQ34617.1 hypothetical protein [Planctomycetaceae bacterium]
MDTLQTRFEAGLANARRYFMGDADVQRAAKKLAARLGEMGIPYAICGGLAVTAHGYARTTEDVDVLLTPDGLRRFKERWLGLGWVEKFPGSKGLRDAEHHVNVDILLTGEYPGDGKPKPVHFPDPAAAFVQAGETRLLSLPVLIELKLASGMSAPSRLKDLADVEELIIANKLERAFATRLDASVRDKYDELWSAAQTREDER